MNAPTAPAPAAFTAILRILDTVIGVEGGYSNHPADRGGPTRWGVTEAVARRFGYKGDMRDLPRERAVEIYLGDYVYTPGFDLIHAIAPAIGEELVEAGINFGPAVPSTWLQMALNSFNNQATLYPDLKEDGKAGAMTRAALASYLAKRGPEGLTVLLKALNCLQGARYIDLGRQRQANEAFTYGWIRARVDLGCGA